MRIRLGFYGEPAKNLSVTGQLKAENPNIAREDYDSSHYAGKGDEKMSFNRLQLDWYAKNGFTLSAGRNELKLGQGLIYWENPIDGFLVRKNFGDKASLLLGAGDASCATWANSSELATLADLSIKASPAVTFTATWYKSHSDATSPVNVAETWNNGGSWWNNWNKINTQRNFQQFAYGVNAQLSNKWNLVAEGIHNGASVTQTTDATGTPDTQLNTQHRNGFWSRLTYGKQVWNQANTWQIYGEYFALGGLAVDSSGWAHHLNISGGNGYGGAGVCGWGLGTTYMLAANTNLELTYYKLKPYDKNLTGFDNYKDVAMAALTYSF